LIHLINLLIKKINIDRQSPTKTHKTKQTKDP